MSITESAGPLQIAAGLEPYAGPLSPDDVAHLLRRAAFGADPGRLLAWTGRLAADVVGELVAEAQTADLPPAPDWADATPPPRGSSDAERMAYNRENGQRVRSFRAEWLAEMHRLGLRERMALAWHDHFVTGIEKYRHGALAYRYLTLLRQQGLGNFRTFVEQIGRDPSMLVYLDGTLNRVGAPNENYAREVLELFTMGPLGPNGSANYSEEDIQELARALTGWVVNPANLETLILAGRHDGGMKTIFGQTAQYGYDEAVSLLFSERGPQIARFVAEKLYRTFVYVVPDPVITSELAQDLISGAFELAPVVQKLLSSAHFFDAAARGAQIKSPVDLAIGLLTETGAVSDTRSFEILDRLLSGSDQVLFNPPNVAGWPGHHLWINTSSLPLRWILADTVLSRVGPPDLVAVAADLHDPNDPEAAFHLPAALATRLFAVPAELLPVPDITDPFGGDLVNFPVPDSILNGPAHVRNLAKLFLGGLPWYEWFLYGDGANDRLLALVRHLVQYPEFQLA